MNPYDTLSYSNQDYVKQTKLKFDVFIDINRELIKGNLKLYYTCLKNTKTIILDVKTLKIFKIINENKENLSFSFVRNKKTSRAVGRGLVISFKDECKKDTKGFLEIEYSTSEKSIALHFSHPTMLKDRNFKYMYTHGPAIFARTLFPCQDTPSAKVIVEAKIKIEKPYTILFSGKKVDSIKKFTSEIESINNKKSDFHTFIFKNKIPIPTYLISFTAAVLEKREFGELCQVYAEPKLINSKKIEKTFERCSDYVNFYSQTYYKNNWGKMIFVVLPNDFPYAGMENPYSIHISKGILTDDGSNKNVVAHEIAHFWSGNLVTTYNWSHFWLNEGLTNYLYRKCFQKLYGQYEFDKELYKSDKRLTEFLKNDKKENSSSSDKSYLSLSPKIEKYDPYSHFSLIPYEKGFSFLFHIESLIGNDYMEEFLKTYFKKFALSTITTFEFVEFLYTYIQNNFSKRKATEITVKLKLKKWIYGTGSIPKKFKIESKEIKHFEDVLYGFAHNHYRVDEMIIIFHKNSSFYKNALLNKLSRSKGEMQEETIENLKEFADMFINERTNRKSLEISTLANMYLLRAKLENDKVMKLKILLILLRTVKFYHCTFLKRVFAILKIDLKMYSNKMIKILSQIGYRLNKLTVFRLLQYIFK
jgi:leukotriene-A4 hydrolase